MSDPSKAPGGIERRKKVTIEEYFKLEGRVGVLEKRQDRTEERAFATDQRMASLEGLTQEVARANEALRELMNERQWFDKNTFDGLKKDMGIFAKWVRDHESEELRGKYGRWAHTFTSWVLIAVILIYMFSNR